MRVVYTPAPGDSLTVEAFGMEFSAGEPVDVTGTLAEKLAANPTFRTASEGNAPGASSPVGDDEDIPAEKPAKKVDGRSREARQAKELAELAAHERATENEDGDGDDEEQA